MRMCPFISNAYDSPTPDLASLVENDGYLLDVAMMGVLAKLYDPSADCTPSTRWPWPLHADADDLEGLPPHVISVNQSRPVRDEGLAYAGKLLRGGVPVIGRTVNGTCHAGDIMFPPPCPTSTGRPSGHHRLRQRRLSLPRCGCDNSGGRSPDPVPVTAPSVAEFARQGYAPTTADRGGVRRTWSSLLDRTRTRSTRSPVCCS